MKSYEDKVKEEMPERGTTSYWKWFLIDITLATFLGLTYGIILACIFVGVPLYLYKVIF